ncbi:hypothetical protein BDZ97DRAFT_1842506 [Flammula alnicola]|nr:hypothetical protein BDZ97DRAFT_1842506 [Flammula alnicola]
MGSKSTNKSKKHVNGIEPRGVDWQDASIEGAALVLGFVRGAADATQLPFLAQAAGATLRILVMVQAVKANKVRFQRLADDTAAFIAVIWRSYRSSSDEECWPRPEMKDALEDLEQTVMAIHEFVQAQASRSKVIRILFSVSDVGKIEEYRERLGTCISKFEVSSHLVINDVLSQILKKQDQIAEQLRPRVNLTTGINQLSTIYTAPVGEKEGEQVLAPESILTGPASPQSAQQQSLEAIHVPYWLQYPIYPGSLPLSQMTGAYLTRYGQRSLSSHPAPFISIGNDNVISGNMHIANNHNSDYGLMSSNKRHADQVFTWS